MPAKRTEPSRSLLDQASGFKYTPAAKTDLAKRFADMRRAAAKAEREALGRHGCAADRAGSGAVSSRWPGHSPQERSRINHQKNC